MVEEIQRGQTFGRRCQPKLVFSKGMRRRDVCRRAATSEEKEENLKQYRRKERRIATTTGKERI
jgi:hypothetical protein